MLKSTIVVKLETEFIHRYKDAPEEVVFLRAYHRHMLQLDIEMEVFNDDRELEFILVKRDLQEVFNTGLIDVKYVDKSCETICKEIISLLIDKYGNREIIVTASEDGENAGRVYFKPSNDEK